MASYIFISANSKCVFGLVIKGFRDRLIANLRQTYPVYREAALLDRN